MNMNQPDQDTARKVLAAAICCDMVACSLSSVGRLNTNDWSKTKMVIFDELMKATAENTAEKK